jgi:hypothetical protein
MNGYLQRLIFVDDLSVRQFDFDSAVFERVTAPDDRTV